MMGMPGKSFKGTLPPWTEEEEAAATRLKKHVETLASSIGERNTRHYRQLLQASIYIQDSFREMGYTPKMQAYIADGKEVVNIEAEIKGAERPGEIVVVGAHYDSPPGSPGANDNASGVAAMLELARQFHDKMPARTLRFVAFVNEEPPFFRTNEMGSRVYAADARKRKDNIVAMIAVETIGYYSDAAGSQKYPSPFKAFFPDTGNFIGFVGDISSRSLVRGSIRTFRETTKFPSEGVAAPAFIEGVGWSDHWAFWQEGYEGIMVTDTAPFRYPHYHEPTDTTEKLDYRRMSRVVGGMKRVVDSLAQ